MSTTKKIRSLVKNYFGHPAYRNPKNPSMEERTLGMHRDVNHITLNNLQSYMTPLYPGILLDIYFKMESQETKKLVAAIAEEHYNITDGVDGNLNYLWYMYHKGTKKDEFRPFVYMAELMLLKKYNYITTTELQNVIEMMRSEDKDNFYIVTLTVKNLRDLRIKEHGIYSKNNKAYSNLNHTYAFEVLNHVVFMETMTEK
jgi:hypothetical protein